MASPPPKGSKRKQLRETARHGLNRFKDFLSPSPRPGSQHSESTAVHHVGAASSSALSDTPSRSTTPIARHDTRLGDANTLLAEASIPGVNPAPSTRDNAPDPSPGPTIVDKMKDAGSIAWTSLETALRVLEKSTEVFPPLKSAVGGFLECLEIVSEAATNRNDYEELTIELTAMATTLNQYAVELGSQDVGSSAGRIVLSIEAEVEQIKKQQSRDMGRRIIRSAQDKEDVLKRYRRIDALFRQLQSEVSLQAWKQLKTSLLRDLLPADDALHNSSYSTTIKRRGCTAETRERVQADLQHWVRDPDGATVYWMNGMAGTGKTTIAYSICEWLQSNRQLGATFFCSRVSSPCRDVSRIIPTIAHQLAQYSSSFRSALYKSLGENPNAGKLNVVWQFKKLLEEPLLKVKGAIPEGVTVVIDALDECEDAYGVQLVLETLLKLAADLPIKFFVTSRPEPSISDKMLSPGGYLPSVLHLHDIEESIVEGDIKKYLTESLSAMPSPPTLEEIDQLAKRAGKLFIYAATTVRYILPDGKRVNSNARLKAVLATTSRTAQVAPSNMKYKELDALYTSVLAAAFDSEQLEGEEAHAMQLVLRTAVCAKEPMTAQTLGALLGITEEDISSALQPLRSVLHVSQATGHVSALHASFPDFIFDRARSTVFFCDKPKHNELLAHCCFDAMKAQLRFNMCHLESSSVYDEDVPDIEQHIKASVPPALFYACRYWGGHLQLAGASDELCSKLTDLLTQRLLFWMEVLNLGRCILMGSDILFQVQDWLSANSAAADTKRQTADAQEFVTRFAASSCKRSTPNIYISALPFCPRSSSVYMNYWGRTRGLIEVKGTAIHQREKAALVTCMTGAGILSATFSPDGTRIASGSKNGAVCVWDARTSDLIVGPLIGHTNEVNSVSFSPDGTRIVSASDDTTIRLWDARTGDTITEPLQGHSSFIYSVAFSPDGTHIVSGSGDSTIRLWDAQSGKQVAKPFEGHTDQVCSVSFSPDGSRIVSGSRDKTIRVWDTRTSHLFAGPFRGHTDKVRSVAFSPDGTSIVSGSYDCTVRVWDVRTGNVVFGPFEEHTKWVISVAFSPDGSRIISGSRDFTIWVWDIHAGGIPTGRFEGHSETVESVAFSPDGTRIVSGSLDHSIRVWDARPTHPVAGQFHGHRNSVQSVSFSPDSTRIVSCSESTIYVWDSGTGEATIQPLEGHEGIIYSVSFSPDGSRIASGSDDHTLRIWDSNAGNSIAGPFEGHTDTVYSVAFSLDGNHIVSGSADCSIRMWDVHTGATIAGPLKGHTGMVKSVAFSPDSTRIVSGSLDHTIRTWDVQTGGTLAGPLKGHSGNILSVAFSPDGTFIASGSADHTVRLWCARTGTARVKPFEGHTDEVNSVVFSPDGSHIASGSDDHTLRLWDAHTGNTIAAFQGHIDEVFSVAFSTDDTRIVSGSSDQSIRVWDVRTHATTRQQGGDANSAPSDVISPIGTQAVPNSDNDANDVPTTAPSSHDLSLTKQAQIHSALTGTGDFTAHNDGWITSDRVPLLWIPPDFRRHLPFPQNSLVIGPQGSAYIDYRNLKIGEQWSECYVPE